MHEPHKSYRMSAVDAAKFEEMQKQQTVLDEAHAVWIGRQPEHVRAFMMHHRIRPYDRIFIETGGFNLHWILGFGEYEHGEVGLVVTHLDPEVDFEAAVAVAQDICPCHLEQPTVKSIN